MSHSACHSDPAHCFKARLIQTASSTSFTSPALHSSFLMPRPMPLQSSAFLGTNFTTTVDVVIIVAGVILLVFLFCGCYCVCSNDRKKRQGRWGKKGSSPGGAIIPPNNANAHMMNQTLPPPQPLVFNAAHCPQQQQQHHPSMVVMPPPPMQQQPYLYPHQYAQPIVAYRQPSLLQQQPPTQQRTSHTMLQPALHPAQLPTSPPYPAAAAAAPAVVAPRIPARPPAAAVAVAAAAAPPANTSDQPEIIPISTEAPLSPTKAAPAPPVETKPAVPLALRKQPYTGVPYAHAKRGFAYENEGKIRDEYDDLVAAKEDEDEEDVSEFGVPLAKHNVRDQHGEEQRRTLANWTRDSN